MNEKIRLFFNMFGKEKDYWIANNSVQFYIQNINYSSFYKKYEVDPYEEFNIYIGKEFMLYSEGADIKYHRLNTKEGRRERFNILIKNNDKKN